LGTVRRLALQLAAVAVALVCAPAAQAAIPSGNLVVNPGAEDGAGSESGSDFLPIPGWETSPNFTAVRYGAPGFLDAADSSGVNGGANFFAGGPDNSGGSSGSTGSLAFQEIDLSVAAPEIDAGGQQMTLRAFLGGFAGQSDNMFVGLVFQDAARNGTAGDFLQGPDAAARRGETKLLALSKVVDVPPGTRSAFITVIATRNEGPYNDGYADNVSLSFGAEPAPEIRRTGTVAELSGRVLIRERGSGRFVPLEGSDTIPLGSEVDATDGVVELTTAADAAGSTQTGTFTDGRFVMSQTRGANPITDLNMKGGSFRKCRRGGQGRPSAHPAARRIRRLSGNARGRFRTRGRNSSATVRGTRWTMEERCDGTLTRAREGSLRIRDFTKRRTITLRAPRSYLARPKRR
jgi:hypothetical protein